jgi:hypothetical protein
MGRVYLGLIRDSGEGFETNGGVDALASGFQCLNLLLVFGPCVAYAAVRNFMENNCRSIL